MRNYIHLIIYTLTLSMYAQRSDFEEINFRKAEQIAIKYKGEDLYNLPQLSHNLTSELKTEVERFRAIYYWVCHNIRGDFNLMNKNERMRRKLINDPKALHLWNNEFKKIVFPRLLLKKETLCTGYTYLIKELSNLAGLECKIIYGYSEENKVVFKNINTPNHSWNAIKLDGKWYLCDPTWSSGYIDMSTFLFEYNFTDSYFLMDPIDFVKSHKPLNKRWTLVTQDSEKEHLFKQNPSSLFVKSVRNPN